MTRTLNRCVWMLVLLMAALFAGEPARAERVKDVASVAGVRTNQLIGYGLVVGLDGTGDQTSQAPFTAQSLRNMLAQYGIVVPNNVNMQLKNVAAVSVHAELPAFAKPGQTLDVTVSSLGNARSLRGGSLLASPLRGMDGQVYAIAQGNLLVGGVGATGADGSSVSINIPSAGRIPNGATVERAVDSQFGAGDSIVLNLHKPDFTTAQRLAEAVNTHVGVGTAQALDGASIQVRAPASTDARVSFLSYLENLEFEPGAPPAKVIVNARTGTVVIGQDVRVSPAAVSHGNLVVSIQSDLGVSQPAPFGEGETVVVPDTEIEVREEQNQMFLFDPGVRLEDIVNAVNSVGAGPGDLVAILQALKEAGALRAELIVI